jgi:hypothetical protein
VRALPSSSILSLIIFALLFALLQTIQENREGYKRLGVQIKDLLLTISDVVDQEKDHEGKLEERKPHVDNLQKYAYEQFEKTLLPLICPAAQGA